MRIPSTSNQSAFAGISPRDIVHCFVAEDSSVFWSKSENKHEIHNCFCLQRAFQQVPAVKRVFLNHMASRPFFRPLWFPFFVFKRLLAAFPTKIPWKNRRFFPANFPEIFPSELCILPKSREARRRMDICWDLLIVNDLPPRRSRKIVLPLGFLLPGFFEAIKKSFLRGSGGILNPRPTKKWGVNLLKGNCWIGKLLRVVLISLGFVLMLF